MTNVVPNLMNASKSGIVMIDILIMVVVLLVSW